MPLLKAHFEPHLDRLAPDDQGRWDRAPMRLLDSKDERTTPFQTGAPVITDHLRPESAAYYDSLKAHLAALDIPYEERPTLVRGLDYYTHTVFEIVPAQADGIAGHRPRRRALRRADRADRRPADAGHRLRHGPRAHGPPSARTGARPRQRHPPAEVLIAALGEGADIKASQDRRRHSAATASPPRWAFGGRSLKAQLRQANRSGARFAVIAGARDLAEDRVTIRDLRTSDQRQVELGEVVGELAGEFTSSAYTRPQD